jgi:hypothetical protein
LTTVIAVNSKDAVILCADSQETDEYAELSTKQAVSKIHSVGRDGDESQPIAAYSGASPYIQELRHCIEQACQETEAKDYLEILKRANRVYSRQFAEARKEIGLQYIEDFSSYASAIFVGYEPRNKRASIYVIQPPHPPQLVSEGPHRATIGTGGLFASLLLSIAEVAMAKIDMGWLDFSWRVVAQVCYLVIARVMNFDGDSGLGANLYRVNHGTGLWEGLNDEQIFPGHGEKGLEHRSTILGKSLYAEIPKKKLAAVLTQRGLLDAMPKQIRELLLTFL